MSRYDFHQLNLKCYFSCGGRRVCIIPQFSIAVSTIKVFFKFIKWEFKVKSGQIFFLFTRMLRDGIAWSIDFSALGDSYTRQTFVVVLYLFPNLFKNLSIHFCLSKHGSLELFNMLLFRITQCFCTLHSNWTRWLEVVDIA